LKIDTAVFIHFERFLGQRKHVLFDFIDQVWMKVLQCPKISAVDDKVDEVIAGFTLTTVDEFLSSNKSEASAAADLALIPPPDATYLQMKQHPRPSIATFLSF